MVKRRNPRRMFQRSPDDTTPEQQDVDRGLTGTRYYQKFSPEARQRARAQILDLDSAYGVNPRWKEPVPAGKNR